MRHKIIAGLCVGAFLIGVSLTTSERHPTEDSPGWNCATMGNKICGPTNYPAWEKP